MRDAWFLKALLKTNFNAFHDSIMVVHQGQLLHARCSYNALFYSLFSTLKNVLTLKKKSKKCCMIISSCLMFRSFFIFNYIIFYLNFTSNAPLYFMIFWIWPSIFWFLIYIIAFFYQILISFSFHSWIHGFIFYIFDLYFHDFKICFMLFYEFDFSFYFFHLIRY